MISLLDHGRAVRKTFIDVTIRHIQSTVGPDHLARTALEMWDRSPERAQLRRLIGPSTLLIVDSGTWLTADWFEWSPGVWRAERGGSVLYVRRVRGSWSWRAVGGDGAEGFSSAEAAKTAAEIAVPA